MSLIKCKECGHMVAKSAKTCPNCGAKLPRRVGVFGWIIAILFGFGVFSGMQPTANRASSSSADTAKPLTQQVTLSKFEWRNELGNSIMMADFWIMNPGPATVKDVEINCDLFADSGTKIDNNIKTIYQTFPAGQTVHIHDFNMGFKHSQATSVKCKVSDFTKF